MYVFVSISLNLFMYVRVCVRGFARLLPIVLTRERKREREKERERESERREGKRNFHNPQLFDHLTICSI
jgi:hypothetical protein